MINTCRLKLLFVAIFLATAFNSNAQCAMKNTAFVAGETLNYNLYFNWKFVWVKVGTAYMSTQAANYNSNQAYKTSLVTKSNGKMDKFFLMRDTLLCYTSTNLEPLYFRKGSVENDRYRLDEVWYNNNNGKNVVKMHRNNKGKHTWLTRNYSTCVFDMMSLLMRARSFSPTNWKKGHVIKMPMADGNGIEQGKLTYLGTEKVKADNGVKYDCLKLRYEEWNKTKNKYKQIATFFVTNDVRHIPIRIDLNLNFGSAKAYLTNMKGLK